MKENSTKSLQQSDKIIRRRRIFRSFLGKSLANRSFTEKASDEITRFSGSILFLVFHIYWFALWIVINMNMIPGIKAFDPYPFGLLTMIVSLEAIVLSVFVLLSQNRGAQIDSLREEVDLQVNLIAEEEITKALELLAEIREKLGIKKEDPELERMLNRIDTSYIERTLQKQMDNENQSIIPLMNKSNGKSEKEPSKETEKKTS